MLSRPYFVDDKTITTTPELCARLRDYYDFLVAYENHLQDGFISASIPVSLSGARQTTSGEPGAVWTLARHNDRETVLHLINLAGQKSDQWRDDEKNYTEPPTIHDLRVRVRLEHKIASAGWASPDVEHGKWHELKLVKDKSGEITFVLPELHYWTAIILRPSAAKY
jgi:dextranase